MEKTSLVCLVPVIHVGYLDLFKKYPDTLYVLGESLLEKWDRFVYLTRDLRRVDQNLIANIISKSGLVREVKILTEENIDEIRGGKIVLPKDEASEWLYEKYLKGQNVVWENVFLRWDKTNSSWLNPNPDIGNRKTTEDEFHREIIKKAQALGERSPNWWRQIGAMAVKDGLVLTSSFNRFVPTQYTIEAYGDLRNPFDAGESHELSNSVHAEASLIAHCAKEGIPLRGADIYVTTFPCPTCAKLIVDSGIKRVYYKDGYSLSDSEKVLAESGIEIVKVIPASL